MLGLTVASQLAQAVASLLLAGFIALIRRSRKRHYLRQLALSFVALAICLGASGIGLAMPATEDGLSGSRTVFSVVGLSMLFPHLFWLWMGSRGALRQPPPSRRLEYFAVLSGIVAGVLLALAAGTMAASGEAAAAVGLRVTLPYAIAGLVYTALAIRLYRVRNVARRMPVSPLIAVSSFVAFGLYLLYVAFFGALMVIEGSYAVHSQVAGMAGLIILMMIALSFVSWLLETEQERSALARDQARDAEQRLLYFRSHDPATGLPNRRQLQDLLAAELLRLRQSKGQQIGVLALGLHRYKMMSESMGWHRAEDMMRDLTRRIRRLLPEHFILSRTGERDFILVMPKIGNRTQALKHANEVLDRLRQPFTRDGRELFIKVSGGLSLAPDDGNDARELISLAERAQLQAIGLGEDLLIHRASGDASEPRDMLQVEAELRQAQRRGEFKLYFQPLISIPRRCIAGFEALLRWEHPQRGLLNPDYFLQDASSLGVLDEMEDRIFDEALEQLSAWHDDLSLAPVSMAINVSARRFVQPDLPERLATQCSRHGVSPGMVTLEITESSAISDFEAGLETIRRLHEHGIKVSLDDFGTGYSALGHLQRLNVDYVKLDRSFVSGIDNDERQLALTQAVVELIHSLGMQVLAEGVETPTQLGHMIQCRVDYVQGFLLGEPRPAEYYRRALEQREITIF